MNPAEHYRIHAATRRHSTVLAQLHRDCFAKGWGPLEFENFFDRTGVFAAIAYQDDKTPVGFVLCWVVDQQCDLLSMGVLPEHRRDGVGLLLLHYALGEAAHMGAHEMLLEVNVHNQAAQTLYEQEGFAVFSQRKAYYTAPDGSKADALCMRKPLR